jgi:hypothetical protein
MSYDPCPHVRYVSISLCPAVETRAAPLHKSIFRQFLRKANIITDITAFVEDSLLLKVENRVLAVGSDELITEIRESLVRRADIVYVTRFFIPCWLRLLTCAEQKGFCGSWSNSPRPAT